MKTHMGARKSTGEGGTVARSHGGHRDMQGKAVLPAGSEESRATQRPMLQLAKLGVQQGGNIERRISLGVSWASGRSPAQPSQPVNTIREHARPSAAAPHTFPPHQPLRKTGLLVGGTAQPRTAARHSARRSRRAQRLQCRLCVRSGLAMLLPLLARRRGRAPHQATPAGKAQLGGRLSSPAERRAPSGSSVEELEDEAILAAGAGTRWHTVRLREHAGCKQRPGEHGRERAAVAPHAKRVGAHRTNQLT